MTGSNVRGPLPVAAGSSLGQAVAAFAERRAHWGGRRGSVQVVEVEVMHRGPPLVVDVVAAMDGHLVHVPISLRPQGDVPRLVGDGEDPVLAELAAGDVAAINRDSRSETGPARSGEFLVFDAMADAEAAALLLEAVGARTVDPALVQVIRSDEQAVTVGFGEELAFTVFNELVAGPRPSTEIVEALDRVGFNHLPAPVALWRRGTHDLGIVQERLSGASSGAALALTSVRDLYASGGPPELAGGDFGAEAHRLGTMTARLHLALDEAFGRQPADAASLISSLEAAIRGRDPLLATRPDVLAVLDELRRVRDLGQLVRTHGDFHLGRVYRTEQGWYVGDVSPGGLPSPPGNPPPPMVVDDLGVVRRTPLADVADMLWSFTQVAATAAARRDPTGREGLRELAEAWQQRNRRAFLAGYLGVPGVGQLVPVQRDAVRALVSALEFERATRVVA